MPQRDVAFVLVGARFVQAAQWQTNQGACGCNDDALILEEWRR